MAAVICKGIGELCSCIGQLVCLPFRLCGDCCEGLGEIITSPFFPYLGVTFGLNIAPVAYAVQGLLVNCSDGGLALWLIINGILAIIHMIASIYIVKQIRKRHDEEAAAAAANVNVNPEEQENNKHKGSGGNGYGSTPSATATPVPPPSSSSGGAGNGGRRNNFNPIEARMEEGRQAFANFFKFDQEDRGAENSCSRIKHVLCYDTQVAIYMLIALFWIVWQFIGGSKLIEDYDNDEDCGTLVTGITISIACGYAYMCLVVCAFCCSLCCLR